MTMLLKSYYNKNLKTEDSPEYKDLAPEYKTQLRTSAAFSWFKLNRAFVKVSKELKKIKFPI